MSNLSIKINLSRIPNVIFSKLTGKSGKKKDCIIIPVEDCHLFVGEKGVYLDLAAYEFKEQKFADTHMVKQSFTKEQLEKMRLDILETNQELSESEIQSIMNAWNPIIGGIKPFERKVLAAEEFVNEQAEDLPF